MGNRGSNQPRRKDRIVIRCRQGLFIWTLILTIVFGAITIMMLLGLLTRGQQISVRILGFFVVALVVTIGFGGITFYFGIKNPRILLYDDKIQLKHGKSDLVGQIPFDNIDRVVLAERVDEWRDGFGNHKKSFCSVQITLHSRKDRDTWWPDLWRRNGFDVEIQDEFNKTMKWLKNRILDKMGNLPDPGYD